MKSLPLQFMLLLMAIPGFGQVVTQAIQEPASALQNVPSMGCGGYHFMKNIDYHSPGYLEQSNKFLQEIVRISAAQQQSHKKEDIITIPVVFHVVYNNDDENLADSVVLNQLEILKNAFRHTHPDTGSVREEFKSVVGDAEIEFVMAEKDPNGNPTNGIVRQSTSITHFGGVLPYSPGETSEIQAWVADSFYTNLFRLTSTERGGSDEWDPYTYLNVWIGDLRIQEPNFNNFEELLFVAIATPPRWHKFWPEDMLPKGMTAKGVLIHYVTVGGNNPNDYPVPYTALNATVKQGKIAVHEVGHYLGLRHIWGDGTDCSTDDFIDDTPLCLTQSNFGCPISKNTCNDDSQGEDQPDMIENYMDYASGGCQVAFTKGQIAVMREVYDKYRKEPSSIAETPTPRLIELYPNPSNGQFTISTLENAQTQVTIKDMSGRVIYKNNIAGNESLTLNESSGIYLVEAISSSGHEVKKLVIE